MIMNILSSLVLLTIFIIQMTTAMDSFPEILTETHNQTFNLSSTAILTCHIRDLGDHHVTWFKIDPSTSISSPLAVGKQLFTSNQRYSISFYSTSMRDSFWSLEIYDLNFSDEGIYICKIANRRASVSISINLHIQIPMIIQPTHVYIEPGANIKLNCSILIPDNQSVVTWQFSSHQSNQTKLHDVHIRKTSLNDILTSYLIIDHAQMYHTGTWTCVYRGQRLSGKVIVRKGIFKHQRTSALLSNNASRRTFSFVFYFLVLNFLSGIFNEQ